MVCKYHLLEVYLNVHLIYLILVAMKILDPNLRDGIHEWRDGKRFVKEGDKLYLEGTTTLAGRYMSLPSIC